MTKKERNGNKNKKQARKREAVPKGLAEIHAQAQNSLPPGTQVVGLTLVASYCASRMSPVVKVMTENQREE